MSFVVHILVYTALVEPLPSQIRPTTLDTFVGQTHLLSEGMPLRTAIIEKHIFSFILWGPPGVGKTTLARIYARSLGACFYELSAVSASKDDVRRIVRTPADLPGQPKVLFLDEIHRFNKAQQDFLLPYVESGVLTLIGATTENPSFEVIAALLSRMRVFTLKAYTAEEMEEIIKQSAARARIPIGAKAVTVLATIAAGDARQALSILEAVHALYGKVTVAHLKSGLDDVFLRYDKKGEEHYNTISAFIKSMRASQPDSALYYLARMITAGEDPVFIARRMIIFASEDIGLAQPTALVVANAVFDAVTKIGLPEALINLAHGVCYLAEAKKDRRAYDAVFAAMDDVKATGSLPIPLIVRNAPTKLMKDEGYGKGYAMYTKESFLPEKLKGKQYFRKLTE